MPVPRRHLPLFCPHPNLRPRRRAQLPPPPSSSSSSPLHLLPRRPLPPSPLTHPPSISSPQHRPAIAQTRPRPFPAGGIRDRTRGRLSPRDRVLLLPLRPLLRPQAPRASAHAPAETRRRARVRWRRRRREELSVGPRRSRSSARSCAGSRVAGQRSSPIPRGPSLSARARTNVGERARPRETKGGGRVCGVVVLVELLVVVRLVRILPKRAAGA